jgi:hypothetical protein
MRHLIFTAVSALALGACGSSQPPDDASAAPEAAVAQAPMPAASVDDEYERLKNTTPVDACAWLTPEKLKAVFPDLSFEVHQKVDPRLSGYVWDSRCVYWAGVGTIDIAKDVPTHTVDIFVGTSVSDAKAQANLASRQELATTTTGYQAQPALGANAYAIANTGVVSLFLVKGQSEVQINVSDLSTPNDEKISKAIALAQSL